MFLDILAGSSFSESTETEFVRRIDRSDARKWLKTVSAFANAQGGLLYIGVNDNRITGFEKKTAQRQRDLFHEMTKSCISPTVDFTTEFLRYEEGGKERFVLEIKVESSRIRPVVLEVDSIPSIYIRRKGYTDAATYEEIIRMSTESRTVSLDSNESGEKYDPDDFTELKNLYLSLNPHSKSLTKKSLMGIGFMNRKGILKNGSTLFKDGLKSDRCTLRCTMYSGFTKESEGTVTSNEYEGNITGLISFALEFVQTRMNRFVVRQEGMLKTLEAYPKDALLRCISTAVIHKDYNLANRPIELSMFRDRLEISVPGFSSFARSVSNDIENLKLEERNPVVSSVMSLLGLNDKKGLNSIVSSYQGADSRHRPYAVTASDRLCLVLADLSYEEGIRDSGIRKLEYIPVKRGSRYDRDILEFCFDRARKAGEIADYLDISDSTYFRKQVLNNLEECDYLESEKIARTKYYRTNPDAVMVL